MNRLLSLAGALALSALASVSAASSVWAADYPSQPIKLIAPYPPGGQTDIVARLVAQPLAEALGSPVVVENKPGANGLLGHDLVAKAKPDGYTILVGNSAMLAVAPNLLEKRPFDPTKDFAPIVTVAGGPLILEVNPKLPVHSLADLIALDKQKPGTLNLGLGGLGTIHHLLGEQLKLTFKTSWTDVPYKGAGPMLVDLIGGQVDFAFDNISSSIGHVRSGQLRAIAVSQKTDLLPGVPALSETPGLEGLEASAWHGILAPAGTPPEIVHKLNSEIVKILKRPETLEKLKTLGLDLIANSPEEFSRFIVSENARWKKVADVSGAKME
ncbi:Bug family tripartite tricarboxylate transporter substrate binding protein [Azospirillum melinis]